MIHYQKKCPKCDTQLEFDDVDYSFDGCQDEYSVCPKCQLSFIFRIRYHSVCNRYEYTDYNTENSHIGYISDDNREREKKSHRKEK